MDTTTGDHEGHATTGGSAAAGAVTGGTIGAVAGGPVGAVVGAIGGAIIGATSERAMHGQPGHKHVEGDELHSADDHHHTGDDHGHDHSHHSYPNPARGAEGQTVQLREEELVARKESVEAGQVRIGKEIVSEERSLEVPVTHEEAVIERHAVGRVPSDRPIGEAASETISVPLRGEQVTAEKRAVVYGEVGVAKEVVQDTEKVSGTVRREEARVEQSGDVHLTDHRAVGRE